METVNINGNTLEIFNSIAEEIKSALRGNYNISFFCNQEGDITSKNYFGSIDYRGESTIYNISTNVANWEVDGEGTDEENLNAMIEEYAFEKAMEIIGKQRGIKWQKRIF